MNRPQSRQDMLRALCAQPHEDDGLPPPRRDRPRNGLSRKDLQLCKQVLRALTTAAGTHPNPRLHDLEFVAVEPAPDASRLRCFVAARAGLPATRAEVLRLLQAARGHLTAEVAAAITRKRCPTLLFELAPPGAEESAP
jgi:ribosome-binding factor A